VVGTDQQQSNIFKAEPEMTTTKMELRECTETQPNHDLVDNKIGEKDVDQHQLIPESCLALESSTLSDTER